jgi:hypothetical protein
MDSRPSLDAEITSADFQRHLSRTILGLPRHLRAAAWERAIAQYEAAIRGRSAKNDEEV